MQQKTTNFKKIFGFGLKAMLNLQVGMMLVLIFSLIYFLGYDTAYVSSNKKLTELESQREKMESALKIKQQEADRLRQWESELKGIDTDIPDVKAGESARVLAITDSKKIADLAQGIGRDETLFPPLPPPHNKLVLESFNLVGEERVQVGDDAVAKTLDSRMRAEPEPEKAEGATPAAKPLLFSKFNYELKLKGTYPAMADLVNQVVQSHKLVSIEKVTLRLPVTPVAGALVQEVDDVGDSVVLEMVMLFSLYFYEPDR